MFSSRTQWNMAPNHLSELIALKRQRGETIVDLTESNPTRCGFTYPEEEILAALSSKSSFTYQPEPRGLPIARSAIAEYYASLGVSINPEHILLTASTSEAYSFLFKLLCNAGDEVLVPQPSYPLFEYLCQLNDVTPSHYRLAYDGEWHIDFESLETACNNRSHVIVLVHPNNPTGSFLKQDEYERVCTFAAEHHCALIVDEVFDTYHFSSDDRRATSMPSAHAVLTFSLNGISKLLGLPQLKLSWIAVHGNPQQRDEALQRLDVITDTFLSVSTPVQHALPKLLEQRNNIGHQIRRRVLSNYHVLQETFMQSSSSVFLVEGGWYAILRLPQFLSDDEWALELLRQQHILIHPGHFYNIHQNSCIVLSLLPPLEVFASAVSQIQMFIEQLLSNNNKTTCEK
jgi:hypothetical protein